MKIAFGELQFPLLKKEDQAGQEMEHQKIVYDVQKLPINCKI